MDPEATQPPPAPREPNTPRTWLKRLWVWIQANPDKAAIAGALVAAFLLGRCTA